MKYAQLGLRLAPLAYAGYRGMSNLFSAVITGSGDTGSYSRKRLRGSDSTSSTRYTSASGITSFSADTSEDQLSVRTNKHVRENRGRFVSIVDGKGWNPYCKDYRSMIYRVMFPIASVMGKVVQNEGMSAVAGVTTTYYLPNPTDRLADLLKYQELPNNFQAQEGDSTHTAPGVGQASQRNRSLAASNQDPGHTRVVKLMHRILMKNTTNRVVYIRIKQWVATKLGTANESISNLHADELKMDDLGHVSRTQIASTAIWGLTGISVPSSNQYERGIGRFESPIYNFWKVRKQSYVVLPPGAILEYHWHGLCKKIKKSLMKAYSDRGGIIAVPGVTQDISFEVSGQLVTASTNTPAGTNATEAGQIAPGSGQMQYAMESYVACCNAYKTHAQQTMRIHTITGQHPNYWPQITDTHQNKINPTDQEAAGFEVV